MPRIGSDDILIQKIQSVQERELNAAVAELLEQNRNRIAKIIRIGGGTDDDIEMILNDAVLELIAKVQNGSFDPSKAKLSTLLFTIAKNKWLDELKRRYQTNKHETTLDESLASPNHTPLNPIEEEIFTLEEREKIARALEQLDATCRELFQMKYREGVSLREIAKKLGVKEDAIKKRHERCKEKLKQIFGQDPRIE